MHLGWEKTLEKLYEYYWFEGMAKYVRKFVENCHACRVSKASSGKIQAELYPIPKTSIPWQTVHMDITGKLSGKKRFQGICHCFSRCFHEVCTLASYP